MFKYVETPAFNENTSHGLLACRINKGESILEFGCAQGGFSAYVKENLNCSVWGIEISKEALDVARSHLDKAILADIEKYEWEDELCGEKFDVVMFADVLEHLKDPVRALKTASGYLKEGGRILFSLPNIAHTDIIAKLLNNRFDYTRVGLLDNTHIHFWGKENIRELCEDAGLFLQEMSATYAIPGSTEQSGYTDDSIQKFISNYNRHDIYQFVCVAYLADYAESKSLDFIDNVLPSPKKSTRVYFDRGEGFTDGDMTVIYESTPGIVNFSVNDIKDAIRIRIDFRESKGFIVKNFFFGFDGKEASPISVVGAMRSDNSYAIVEDDSQFVFDVPSGTENFNVSAEIIMLFNSEFLSSYVGRLISREQNLLADLSNAEEEINEKNVNLKKTNDILYDTRKKLEDTTTTMENMQSELKQVESELQQAKSELEKTEEKLNSVELQLKSTESELDHYKTHYFAAINQRTELRAEVAQLKAQYDCISNSQFWKITKPFRVVLDLVKKPLRRVKFFRLVKKGFVCLKENGFKYTIKKINDKIHRRQNYAAALKPIYTEKELEAQKKRKFDRTVKFSILVPLYNTPEKFLHEMIRSVVDQTYSNWELCLADGSDKKHTNVGSICKKYAQSDKRIKYKKLEKNLGISGNTNACIEMSSGDYIALFDHDDLLHPAALYDVMTAICEKDADFIYTDENTFHKTPEDAYCPHFKPDYAPDTLRTNNYICHFTVFKKKLIDKVGMFRPECDGSQDYDMVLRLTEQANRIVHIPKILYYWRAHAASVATDISAKPYVIEAAHKALRDHLDRVGLNGTVMNTTVPSMYRIKYDIENNGLVSIIIANKDHTDDLDKCLSSIVAKTTYKNYEIIVVENNSEDPETWKYYENAKKKYGIKVVEWISSSGEFNYSAINNYGVKFANGEYILLLNNDVEIISPEWIEEMLMFAQRSDIGAVGAKLYYPDNTVQHAGIGIGLLELAGHYHRNFPKGHPGYMGRLIYAHNVSAVTAACIMIPRKVWDEVGGLDETFKVAFNDVDLCMKIRKSGYLIVFTPFAELYHYESKSRGLDSAPEKRERFVGEVTRFQTRWKKELDEGDPYYNPNFSLDKEDFSIKF